MFCVAIGSSSTPVARHMCSAVYDIVGFTPVYQSREVTTPDICDEGQYWLYNSYGKMDYKNFDHKTFQYQKQQQVLSIGLIGFL